MNRTRTRLLGAAAVVAVLAAGAGLNAAPASTFALWHDSVTIDFGARAPIAQPRPPDWDHRLDLYGQFNNNGWAALHFRVNQGEESHVLGAFQHLELVFPQLGQTNDNFRLFWTPLGAGVPFGNGTGPNGYGVLGGIELPNASLVRDFGSYTEHAGTISILIQRQGGGGNWNPAPAGWFWLLRDGAPEALPFPQLANPLVASVWPTDGRPDPETFARGAVAALIDTVEQECDQDLDQASDAEPTPGTSVTDGGSDVVVPEVDLPDPAPVTDADPGADATPDTPPAED